MIKYSKGFLEYINEEALEIKMTDIFFEQMSVWCKTFSGVEELAKEDEELSKQGIVLEEDRIKFDGNLNYSKFYKMVSDEGEGMNDPNYWQFSIDNLPMYTHIDFSDKTNPLFNSKLVLLKYYVLRKVDEVAFVTSRYVHCPSCNSSYAVPASKIEFMATFKCDKMLESNKPCNTTLKKFPARKMIPTYIYEMAVEIKSSQGTEYKEFFLESFQELQPGFHTGLVFGRTESKSNSFYFTGLKAKREKSNHIFTLVKKDGHIIHSIIDSVFEYMKKVGFILDNQKARSIFYIETMKKIMVSLNKEINLDHSLYFGAPGIGKSVALTLLHYMFYSNAGLISGPRFSLAGLTGGQKEVFYQDVSKKKNVPGLFSNQAFVFDEINNDQFLSDDKSVNLLKSVALAPSGTSSTVGGKEFMRISLIAGSANYDMNHLRHYENRIKKVFNEQKSKEKDFEIQSSILAQSNLEMIPDDFDFYAPLRKYRLDIPKALKTAVMKVRDDGKNYLTAFPKALMERFYWTVLVHPKYDRNYLKEKRIKVLEHLKSRKSIYTQRELFAQLFSSHFEECIKDLTDATIKKFDNKAIEKSWSDDAEEFLTKMSTKYAKFFSMFQRVNQVSVFCLFSLSLINKETILSGETKRVFERLISLLHTPVEIKDFHDPDFDNYEYLGESKPELVQLIKDHPEEDLKYLIDYDDRKLIRVNLATLENQKKIIKIADYTYKINIIPEFGDENVEANK